MRAKILAREYKTNTLYMTTNIRDTVMRPLAIGFGIIKPERSLEVGKLLLMNMLCTRTGQVHNMWV